ncbi:MAG: hypothetical protein HN590_08195 [Calditrichaeota bacterium]|nr:hypothetical protein [Calditrichota bacterium]
MKTLKGYPLIAILIAIGVSGISLMTHCSPLLSGGGYHPESWRGENGAYQGFFEMESKPGTGLFASIYFERIYQYLDIHITLLLLRDSRIQLY